ncbi:MAG: site-specific integrase [Planctomycetes bacterium]|nr:site-specific integrase [Planctomycetota bacterium]
MGVRFDAKIKKFIAQVGSGKLGTRKKKTFDLKRDAERWCREEGQRRDVGDHRARFQGESLVTDMLDVYMESMKHRTRLHQNDVRAGIEHILTVTKVRFFRDLKPTIIHRFKNVDGQSPRTINKKLGYIKTMCNHLEKHGWISKNPLTHLEKLKYIKGSKRALTSDECDELLKTVYANSPDVFFPIVFTGLRLALRKGELLTLEWTDIDFNRDTVSIKDKPHILVNGEPHHCKWGSSRVLPLFPELKKLLQKLPRTSTFVFPTEDGSMRWHNFNRDFVLAMRGAKIEQINQVTPHTLRHTRISQLISYEKRNIKEVQRFAGHSNLQTTIGYTHLLEPEGSLIDADSTLPSLEQVCGPCPRPWE